MAQRTMVNIDYWYLFNSNYLIRSPYIISITTIAVTAIEKSVFIFSNMNAWQINFGLTIK